MSAKKDARAPGGRLYEKKKKYFKGRTRQFSEPTEEEPQEERSGSEESESSGEEESAPTRARPRGRRTEDSGSEESGDEEDNKEKPKGVQSLIETENINRKAGEVGPEEAPMSRREREELERQRKREEYLRLTREGKTEQGKADLARLAQIRKEREEAARKRQQEKEAKEKRRVEAKAAFLKKK